MWDNIIKITIIVLLSCLCFISGMTLGIVLSGCACFPIVAEKDSSVKVEIQDSSEKTIPITTNAAIEK